METAQFILLFEKIAEENPKLSHSEVIMVIASRDSIDNQYHQWCDRVLERGLADLFKFMDTSKSAAHELLFRGWVCGNCYERIKSIIKDVSLSAKACQQILEDGAFCGFIPICELFAEYASAQGTIIDWNAVLNRAVVSTNINAFSRIREIIAKTSHVRVISCVTNNPSAAHVRANFIERNVVNLNLY